MAFNMEDPSIQWIKTEVAKLRVDFQDQLQVVIDCVTKQNDQLLALHANHTATPPSVQQRLDLLEAAVYAGQNQTSVDVHLATLDRQMQHSKDDINAISKQQHQISNQVVQWNNHVQSSLDNIQGKLRTVFDLQKELHQAGCLQQESQHLENSHVEACQHKLEASYATIVHNQSNLEHGLKSSFQSDLSLLRKETLQIEKDVLEAKMSTSKVHSTCKSNIKSIEILTKQVLYLADQVSGSTPFLKQCRDYSFFSPVPSPIASPKS